MWQPWRAPRRGQHAGIPSGASLPPAGFALDLPQRLEPEMKGFRLGLEQVDHDRRHRGALLRLLLEPPLNLLRTLDQCPLMQVEDDDRARHPPF